jgi:hypothetical protein
MPACLTDTYGSNSPAVTRWEASLSRSNNGAPVAFHGTVEVEGKKGASSGALTDSSGKDVIASVGKDLGIPPGCTR